MPSERHWTVLVVDDEVAIHRALARTLRREPYELIHAYDTAEALAVLRERHDVAGVICDQYMPGTNGLDLLMDVRRRHPAIVTVLLTGQADLRLVMRALNEGRIHRFFTKPWLPAHLRDELRALLGRVDEDAARREHAAKTEERLRREMTPLRDEHTGAFLIDPDL